VIVIVGLIVLATLRTGYAAGRVDHEQVRPLGSAASGRFAGFASGISGPVGARRP